MSDSDEESVVSTYRSYGPGDIFGKYDPDKLMEDDPTDNSTDDDDQEFLFLYCILHRLIVVIIFFFSKTFSCSRYSLVDWIFL